MSLKLLEGMIRLSIVMYDSMYVTGGGRRMDVDCWCVAASSSQALFIALAIVLDKYVASRFDPIF